MSVGGYILCLVLLVLIVAMFLVAQAWEDMREHGGECEYEEDGDSDGSRWGV